MTELRRIAHLLCVHRWQERIACHRSIHCCQYVDRPNCNNPSSPREHT